MLSPRARAASISAAPQQAPPSSWTTSRKNHHDLAATGEPSHRSAQRQGQQTGASKGTQAQQRCSTWWTLPRSSRETVLMDSCVHYQILPLYLWLHPDSRALPVSITYWSPEDLEMFSPQRHTGDQEII